MTVFTWLVIIVLISVNALYVAAEFAAVAARRSRIRQLAEDGNAFAASLLPVLQDARKLDRYIAARQIGITFASLGLGIHGEHVLAHWLVNGFDALGASRWIAAHAVASVLAVAILTYFHIALGEMVPRSLALQQAERTVLWMTRPMQWVRLALYPLVLGLNGPGNGLLRLVGVNRQKRATWCSTTASGSGSSRSRDVGFKECAVTPETIPGSAPG